MKSNKPAKVKQIITAAMVSLLLTASFCAPVFATNETIPSKKDIVTQTTAQPKLSGEKGAADPSDIPTASANVAPQGDADEPIFEQPVQTASPDKNTIAITTLDELQRIGSEGYPLDGTYELIQDIDGEGASFTPIGNSEKPFSGKFSGNGHRISNLVIQSDEGTGIFNYFTGAISSVNLTDIKVNTKSRQSILFNVISGEAEITDIYIEGDLLKQDENTVEASGGFAAVIESAKSISNVQAYADNPNRGKLDGAFVGNNNAPADVYRECLWSNAYGSDTAFGVDSLMNKADGVYTITPEPSYVTLAAGGKSAEVQANTETAERFGLLFREWSFDNIILECSDMDDGRAKVVSRDETGAEDIAAVYEKEWADGSKSEVRFYTPVIVSQNVNEEKPLEPIDPIFPNQIDEVKPLEPLDDIFPSQIEQSVDLASGISIVENPQSQTGAVGDNITFRVRAEGEGLVYQWQESTDGGQTWTDIPGANETEYVFTATQEDHGKRFRCAILEHAAESAEQ
ncbi:hypothetical protein [Christensenella hongkongensis]|uniref:hypothetical protein n=1 Tax=Christensenella hongkongensis TaxID=270498 RepID=UPI0026728F0E|nr:hypothetical protein [Christensenella hongkongensis]